MGDYGTAQNGSPATYGVAPGARITIEYVKMAGDFLTLFDPEELVMRLNVEASWAELLEAYVFELKRAFGMSAGEHCPVIPLQRYTG